MSQRRVGMKTYLKDVNEGHDRAEKAEARNAELFSNHERLRDALEWALPLAEIAFENARQERLKYGHDDIGKGTNNIGLWPEEVNKRNKARDAIQQARKVGTK